MTGICGYMSGGKTYTAVEMMMDDLMNGHIVCTNIFLKCRGVSSYLGCSCLEWKRNLYYLTDDPEECSQWHHVFFYDYSSYPCGSVRGNPHKVCIYIDEASSFFDSIEVSSSSKIKEFAAWVRHTEKRGQFIFPIVQFPSDLQKRFRQHCTEYIYCANSEKIRLPIVNLNLPKFFHNFILRATMSSDGEKVLSPTVWKRRDPRIYDCYNTAQQLVGTNFFTTQAHTFNRKKTSKWKIRLLIILALYYSTLCLCYLLRRVFS